jgi:hypothetical protein
MPIERAGRAGRGYLYIVGTGEKLDLAERVSRGGYVVDPEAVAEAIIRRWQSGWSLVLVSPQPADRAPVVADEEKAATGADVT